MRTHKPEVNKTPPRMGGGLTNQSPGPAGGRTSKPVGHSGPQGPCEGAGGGSRHSENRSPPAGPRCGGTEKGAVNMCPAWTHHEGGLPYASPSCDPMARQRLWRPDPCQVPGANRRAGGAMRWSSPARGTGSSSAGPPAGGGRRSAINEPISKSNIQEDAYGNQRNAYRCL